MAERISGSEESFVKKMNERAKELGLKNTNFVNTTGLTADNHYSSAYDMSVIAKELIKHEKILEFTSTYEEYLRKDSNNPFWLVNTNRLVFIFYNKSIFNLLKRKLIKLKCIFSKVLIYT